MDVKTTVCVLGIVILATIGVVAPVPLGEAFQDFILLEGNITDEPDKQYHRLVKICDGDYPDICITPSSDDLDCSDIPYENFKVSPPDPHNFDLDKNGIGCE